MLNEQGGGLPYVDGEQKDARQDLDMTIRQVVEAYGGQRGLFFTHAIRDGWVAETNSPLHEGVDWRTKLAICLTLSPTLSTATIREGDGVSNFFGRSGVLLRDGNVQSASHVDAGTQASLSTRTRIGKNGDSIQGALIRSNGHNEFVIAEPQVAGIFYCLDEYRGQDVNKGKVPDLGVIAGESNKLGLPLYFFKEGKFYEGEIVQGAVNLGEAVDARAIFESTWSLSQENEQMLKEGIMRDSPFRPEMIAPKIYTLLVSRDNGRDFFMRLNAGQIIKRNTQDGVLSESYNMSRAYRRTVYKIHGGQLIKEDVPGGESQKKASTKYIGESRDGVRDILLGSGVVPLNRAIFNSRGYLDAAGSLASQYSMRNDAEGIAQLAFHIYGFVEQAERMGDSATVASGRALAQTLVPEDQYKALVSERLGPNGEFRITEDEIRRAKSETRED